MSIGWRYQSRLASPDHLFLEFHGFFQRYGTYDYIIELEFMLRTGTAVRFLNFLAFVFLIFNIILIGSEVHKFHIPTAVYSVAK